MIEDNFNKENTGDIFDATDLTLGRLVNQK